MRVELRNKRIFLTGGAGFIGSHLLDRLLETGNEVTVYDNFSSGRLDFLRHLEGNNRFNLVEGDLLQYDKLKDSMKDFDIVFHLAANPDVRLGAKDTRTHLDQNIIATYNVLEAMKEKGAKEIVFTSTSTVYGEAEQIPTKEDYGPLIPISLYASSKLACEAMISAYCYTFDMVGTLFRFANVVGPRSTHGVTYDFANKLRKDPKKLEMLGRDPGTTKSYLYISDCIDGMIVGTEKGREEGERVAVFNIGSQDYINVRQIADIVCKEMGLEDVGYQFTGGVDQGRGWKGDVRTMLLSIEKLDALGWIPKYNSSESIALTARAIVQGQ